MNINFSDPNFISNVENYNGSKLQKKADIKKIIELAVTSNKVQDFENLIFTSKYICGLMRVLKNAPGNPEVNNIELVKKDFNENLKKGIEQIKEIIKISEKNDIEYFDSTYFTLTTQNFTSLSQLFADLELVKKYTNHLKRLT